MAEAGVSAMTLPREPAPHARRSARWSSGRAEILDAGPRELPAGSPTIPFMQSTEPIRRYVLLRQRGPDASASRWSMERVAPAQRGAARAPLADQPTKPAAPRS
jgi:hypothetical protein